MSHLCIGNRLTFPPSALGLSQSPGVKHEAAWSHHSTPPSVFKALFLITSVNSFISHAVRFVARCCCGNDGSTFGPLVLPDRTAPAACPFPSCQSVFVRPSGRGVRHHDGQEP